MVQFGSGHKRDGEGPFNPDMSRADSCQSHHKTPVPPVSGGEQVLNSLTAPAPEGALCQTENSEVKSLAIPFLQLLESKEAQQWPVYLKQGDVIRMFVAEVPEMRARRNLAFQELSGSQKFFVALTSGMYTPRVLANFYQEASQLLHQVLVVLQERGLIEARGFTGLITDHYHGIGSVVVSYKETAIHLTQKGREFLEDQR